MAGEAVHEAILAHQAQHPGMKYQEAFKAVLSPDNPDLEIQRYRAQGTSHEVATIRGLEAELRHQAGRVLHQVAGRRDGQSAASYVEALRTAGLAHADAGRAYGIEPPRPAERRWWIIIGN